MTSRPSEPAAPRLAGSHGVLLRAKFDTGVNRATLSELLDAALRSHQGRKQGHATVRCTLAGLRTYPEILTGAPGASEDGQRPTGGAEPTGPTSGPTLSGEP